MNRIVDPRQIVTDTAFRVDPFLLGADLATPWRRAAALGTDLVIAGTVSSLGLTAVVATIAAVMTFRIVRRGRPGFARATGAVAASFCVMVVTCGVIGRGPSTGPRRGLIVVDHDADPGAVAATATATHTAGASVSADREAIGRAASQLLGFVKSPQTAEEKAEIAAAADAIARSVEALQRFGDDDSLVAQVARLKAENDELREALEAPSLMRTLRGAAGDFGLTLGWVGVYFSLFMAIWNGVTPGKRLFALRVYRLDGRPISLWAAFERFAGYSTGLATGLGGFAQVFWDANRQCIHDRIAGTVVVRMDGDVPRRRWTDKQAIRGSGPSRPAPPSVG